MFELFCFIVDVCCVFDCYAIDIGWFDFRYLFLFGYYRDAVNTHYGLLLVNNDDVVRVGVGFDIYFYCDMEIVIWVFDGLFVY